MTAEKKPEIIGNLCDTCYKRCRAIDSCHGDPVELRIELEDPWYVGCPVNDATIPQIAEAMEAQGLEMRVEDPRLLAILQRARNIHGFWNEATKVHEPDVITDHEDLKPPTQRVVQPISSAQREVSPRISRKRLSESEIENLINNSELEPDLPTFCRQNKITPYAFKKLIKKILQMRFEFSVLDEGLSDEERNEIDNFYNDLFPVQPWDVGVREKNIREHCELYVQIVVQAWLAQASGEEVVQPMLDQAESTYQLAEAGTLLDTSIEFEPLSLNPIRPLGTINLEESPPKIISRKESLPVYNAQATPLYLTMQRERHNFPVWEALSQGQIRKIFNRTVLKPSTAQFAREWSVSDEELLTIICHLLDFRFLYPFKDDDHLLRDKHKSRIAEAYSSIFSVFNLGSTEERSIAIRGRCLLYVKIITQEWLQNDSEKNTRAEDFKTMYPMFKDVNDLDELFEVYIEETEKFADLLELAQIRTIQFNDLRDKLIMVRKQYPLDELSSSLRLTLRNELNRVYIKLGVSDELLDQLIPHFNFLVRAMVELNLIEERH